MFAHEDSLDLLNSSLPLKQKIIKTHESIRQKLPFIARIAIALYDSSTGVLKTYLHSSGDDEPLIHYQSLLKNAQSLVDILKHNRPRVVNNLHTFDEGHQTHTKKIAQQGYSASYTMPMYHNGEFFGFLFFNSFQKDVFTEKVLSELDVFGHLISLLVINEVSNIKILSAAVKTTIGLANLRDPETGSHLDRMSRYSRLIANELADKYELDDDYIEHLFMFAPLHDIGKLAIPDEILLKPGTLTEDEMKIMKTHSEKGRQMVDDIVSNFGFEKISSINMLRNIAQFHHETVNGSGYPSGKREQDIPLEARIVAVADVFDALTSKRPYKKAWTNSEAVDLLSQLSGEELDRDCVAALINQLEEIAKIQAKFKEDEFG